MTVIYSCYFAPCYPIFFVVGHKRNYPGFYVRNRKFWYTGEVKSSFLKPRFGASGTLFVALIVLQLFLMDLLALIIATSTL